jgi:hypothetical protein
MPATPPPSRDPGFGVTSAFLRKSTKTLWLSENQERSLADEGGKGEGEDWTNGGCGGKGISCPVHVYRLFIRAACLGEKIILAKITKEETSPTYAQIYRSQQNHL